MKREPISPEELQRRLDQLDQLAHLMDEAFRVPGTNIRVGLDSLAGLVPGVGDAFAALTHVYLIGQGHRLGARKRTQARLLANALIDVFGGAVPLVGDVFDVYWKANRKNVELLREELHRMASVEGRVVGRR